MVVCIATEQLYDCAYMFSFRVIPEEGSLWLEYLIHGQIRFVFPYHKPSFLVRLAFVMR